ncbi:MAG: DUF2791 family P-loop domain-containing protein [Chloroflexales bacterium]|nr:DUF2791 family P-loop domain-containing protein [Chloroflexales bacterium]
MRTLPGSAALLLGYLALHSSAARPVARARLAGCLWPDLPQSQAQRALSEALYRLRQSVGGAEGWLLASERELALANVRLDVEEFRRRTASADLDDWAVALDVYSADLLEDLDADWLLSPRLMLRERYLTTMARLCTSLSKAGRFADALACAQRWVLADPYNEDAHRYAMRLYAQMGRRAAAVQQYEQLTRLLQEEFQAAPLPETRALADTIRGEYDLEDEQCYAHLVGRRRERALLLKLVEQAQAGHGGLVLLEGEAGSGKTFLLEALASSASWRGMTVVWGHATKAPGATSFAPLADALQQALAGPRASRARHHLTPEARATLATVLPRLEAAPAGPGYAGLSETDKAAASRRGPALAAALSELLALLGAQAPHLVLLDNLQWADAACWRAIRSFAAQLADTRGLLVLSYRGDELRADQALWPLVRALERDLAPPHLCLRGLSGDECRELARVSGVSLSADQAQELWRRTDGNVLFVKELLAQQMGAPLSTTLTGLIERRLAGLAPIAYAALEAAAILGAQFSYDCWYAVGGGAVLEAAAALIGQGWLIEADAGYAFRRAVVRERIYDQIDPARRRTLHRRCAEVGRHEGMAPELVAWHFAQAKEWAASARWYRCAAEHATAQRMYGHARELYERALELARHTAIEGSDPQALQMCLAKVTALEATWQALEPSPAPYTVALARADVPAGRPLRDADRVEVRWSIDAGEADVAVLRREGKVALRQRRIMRLVAEAHAQGGRPTQADLARALGVTERTIGADIAALQASGFSLPPWPGSKERRPLR